MVDPTILWFFGGLIALAVIQWLYKRVLFRIKYPIISADLPNKMLEYGDIVTFDGVEYEYRGFVSTDIGAYQFVKCHTICDVVYKDEDQIRRDATMVKNDLGIKWRRRERETLYPRVDLNIDQLKPRKR